MAGEAPGGAAVHACGGESGEAQLVLAGGDVFHNSLQGLEVGDLVDGVAGFSKQGLVDDDAVALVAIADGAELAVCVIEHVSVGAQLVSNGSAGQVQAVLAPGVHSGGVADNEQGGCVGLVHLGGEGLVVGAGSGGDDLYGNAGLFGVHLGDLLQSLVGFGLEVQPVDGACGGCALLSGSGALFCGGCALCGSCGFAACAQGEYHGKAENKCENLFHLLRSPYLMFFLI